MAGKRRLFGDEPHLQRGSWNNPTYRYRHGTWLLRSTSDTREHRRELRKGRIDRGLLRAGSVRARVMAVLATDTCNSHVARHADRAGDVDRARAAKTKALLAAAARRARLVLARLVT